MNSPPNTSGPAPEAGVDIFVARQPIFDREDRRVAYELLYRASATASFAAGISSERMSAETIVSALMGIGLEQLTAGTRAYINFGREMLLAGAWELLPPGAVTIELLETVEPDAEVVAACERLRAKGYTLALDDFVYDERFEPLLRLAQIVKVDVLDRPAAELEQVAQRLRPRAVRLLAERVETAEVRDTCRALGYELFQGYHFSRPETVSKREISTAQGTIIRLMNLLRNDAVSDAALEGAFRSDPGLSYRLLRIVNAAALGGGGIEEIGHAIRLVGRATLHRWLALLLVSSIASDSGVDAELVEAAVVRARLCEVIALAGGKRGASGALFMVGLFSRIDVLLRVPLDDIVQRIDLSPEIRDALLRRSGPYAGSLDLVDAYEQGEWASLAGLSGSIGVPPSELPELYLQSTAWAREQLRAAAG